MMYALDDVEQGTSEARSWCAKGGERGMSNKYALTMPDHANFIPFHFNSRVINHDVRRV